MKKKIISKCGYRCDLCLAFQPNVRQHDRRKELSDGWFNLFGFRIAPEDIICDGCVSCVNPRLIDKNCPVRPCVTGKGLENCADCDAFICEKLMQRIVSRKYLEEKLNRKVTEMEYTLFIKPYESKERLEEIKRIKR